MLNNVAQLRGCIRSLTWLNLVDVSVAKRDLTWPTRMILLWEAICTLCYNILNDVKLSCGYIKLWILYL